MSNILIEDLKIGRNKYTITDKDEFMDNGACIQLLTQNEDRIGWSRRPIPALSKAAIKTISKFTRVQITHEWRSDVEVFNLIK